jgi:hypothetical protein
MNKKQTDESKYLPYSKSDFRKFWMHPDYYQIDRVNILRPLTTEEKSSYGTALDDEYENEMYLVKLKNGEEFHVYDNEILQSDDESYVDDWKPIIKYVADCMENNDKMLQDFIKYCKFEKFLERWY